MPPDPDAFAVPFAAEIARMILVAEAQAALPLGACCAEWDICGNLRRCIKTDRPVVRPRLAPPAPPSHPIEEQSF